MLLKSAAGHPQIHIAHVVDSFDIGGAENGIVNLMNHMDPDRFTFSLYTFGSLVGDSRARVVCDSVRYYVLNKRAGNDFRVPSRLAHSFRKDGVTLVHTHNWGTYIEGLAAAKLAGVPVVVHGEHGTLFFPAPRPRGFRRSCNR